jgi:protein-S-isoprenylcysteine O-methyltransferase Ste14
VNPERPLLEDVEQQVRGLVADVHKFLLLRWQLARLEIESAVAVAKRLAVVAGIAAVMGLTGLPLLAASAAELLDGRLGLSRTGWLVMLGSGLLVIAAMVGWIAWRRFRQEWRGLEETLEELREDLFWFREWQQSEPGETTETPD